MKFELNLGFASTGLAVLKPATTESALPQVSCNTKDDCEVKLVGMLTFLNPTDAVSGRPPLLARRKEANSKVAFS